MSRGGTVTTVVKLLSPSSLYAVKTKWYVRLVSLPVKVRVVTFPMVMGDALVRLVDASMRPVPSYGAVLSAPVL